ncbi:uncharacterized protein BDW47DRAFT_47431 [Aspergillus candidus]|uniref:Transmembrane protein n=1 Tax=Aspergillus candidus TaxID=41067 RepID=A0A2I2F7Q4_ASPCN|nr:hypothetical protein BDW47DRAFT_47431 [Aspergillus candidus]PLB36653.1 hypothetical protein BDW47DRAFT_47431 [Aspergillus candidus]
MILFPARRTGGRRSSWMLLVVLVIALCAVSAVAQDKTAADNPDAATTDVAPPETKETAKEPAEETATEEPTSKETSSEEKTTEETKTEEKTTDSKPTSTKESESESKTTTDSESTTSETETTSSSEKTSTSKAADHPEVTVPPTADAPYMQKSNTPEGTVFIAVGAVLGFLGFAVLAWRGMVAWSVNRSVRQAALIHSSESKGLLRSRRKRSTVRPQGPVAPVSLEKMSGNKRSSHMHQRSSKVPSSSSGLFFSPTAGMQSSGNRASNYLPAGYYAAGNATAGGSGSGGGGHHTHFSDLPGIGPQSQGYTRTKSGPSPPGTPTQPQHPPSGPQAPYYGSSTSDVNLSSAPQGRTPSAYLEDLFENHAPQRNQNKRYRG